mmetsp:Transcript_18807/g.47713  ORF Transcript_18807/g.47713 Transcript_18807/m.47713 type:complete len:167 (-) Transcript_18807:4575-5075(-)
MLRQLVVATASRTSGLRLVSSSLIPRFPHIGASKDAIGKLDIDTMRTESTEKDVRDDMTPEEIAIARKKLIYRSKQRGWLEVDLLLGSFAKRRVPEFSIDEMKQFNRILSFQTVQLFNILIGTEPTPTEIDGPIMKELQHYLREAGPVDRTKINMGYKGNQSVDYR